MHRPRALALPAALAAVMVVAPVASSLALAADPVVTVKRGDTLTHIAKRHGVPVATLVALNELENPNRIFPGQQLRLAPATPSTPTPAAPATPAARIHVVAAGEHLTRIAKRYGVTIAAIATANRLADPSRIYVGQRLTIPGAAAPATDARVVPPSSSMPASMAALVTRRSDVGALVAAEARRFGVPVAFAQAVAWQESGWQQGVVSRAGAVGIMQLMPATAAWVGEAMLGERVAIDDARHNVRAGVRLLAHYLDRYDGNRDLVLAAYYQGQAAVDRHGIFPVSRPYIASIRTLERLFGG